jgi:uncharacterized protein YbjT (DUF2867 family)
MRVFVTGATGALGGHLVPGLVAAGYEVTATTRSPGKAGSLREAGAEPMVVDGLDREAVIDAAAATIAAVGRGAPGPAGRVRPVWHREVPLADVLAPGPVSA